MSNKRLGNTATKCRELQGYIENTESRVKTHTIALELDRDTAWALCNVLSKRHITEDCRRCLDKGQHEGLVSLGKAIAALIDHPNRDFLHLRKDEA